MKKTLLILCLVFVVGLAPVAHAQNVTCTIGGTDCPTGDTCQSDGQGGTSCVLTQPGSNNANTGAQTTPTSTCVANPQITGQCYDTSTTLPCTCPSTTGAATAGVTAGSNGFVPLTNIPGLTNAQPTQTGLAGFLNNLYKYLIGIAAVLAVIEIIWGGLQISTQDSVSKKGEGKERIQQALLGLVLVLAPVLVFTIINPSILNLSLNLPPIQQVAPSTSLIQNNSGTPCTSGCNTGVTGAGLINPGGTEEGLFACNGTNCTAATQSCSGQTASVAASGSYYSGTIVCTSSSGVIDQNGATGQTGGNKDATGCKAGDNMAVNCALYNDGAGD